MISELSAFFYSVIAGAWWCYRIDTVHFICIFTCICQSQVLKRWLWKVAMGTVACRGSQTALGSRGQCRDRGQQSRAHPKDQQNKNTLIAKDFTHKIIQITGWNHIYRNNNVKQTLWLSTGMDLRVLDKQMMLNIILWSIINMVIVKRS